MNRWEAYDPDVFVGRQDILKEIARWADRPSVDKRLWSIVAPPGTGKTWLLKSAQRMLERSDETDLPLGQLVFWVDVPDLVNREETANLNNMLDHQAVWVWLKNVHRQALSFCAEVKPLDSDASVSRNIESIVTALCERCHLRYAPIVIVDAYDEVTPDPASVVAERILEPFISKECVRMLIGRRDDFALKRDALRRNQRVVKLDVFREAQDAAGR